MRLARAERMKAEGGRRKREERRKPLGLEALGGTQGCVRYRESLGSTQGRVRLPRPGRGYLRRRRGKAIRDGRGE
jgi:hypothetical protein